MTDQAQPWRQVRVSFRKQVSDGNYGTEAAEVSLEDYVAPDIDPEITSTEAIAGELLNEARYLVHVQLRRSPSLNVARAMNMRGTEAAVPPDDEPSF